MNKPQIKIYGFGLAALAMLWVTASPLAATALPSHGGRAGKACQRCQLFGEDTNCLAELINIDDINDTLMLDSGVDQLVTAAGTIRTNLTQIIEVGCEAGFATCAPGSGTGSPCTVGGSLPCVVGPHGNVIFAIPPHTISGLDVQSEGSPLQDQTTFTYEDLCDQGSPGCSTLPQQTNAGAKTLVCIEDGNPCTNDECAADGNSCQHPPKPDSGPCPDTDGNACTAAGCDANGNCDQNHISKLCTIDECNGGCNPTTGQCTPKVSTPCTDSDNNTCTTAGCELTANPEVAACVQTHVLAPNGTPCADTDNSACTTAGCDGAGHCDQGHVTKTCTVDQCNGGCNPATGQCTPKVSDLCTDTDGNDCTTAGCELTTNPEVSACVQTHVLAPNSTPCADTDSNACTTAGCDGAGHCDQGHVTKSCTVDDCNGACDKTTGLCPRKSATSAPTATATSARRQVAS